MTVTLSMKGVGAAQEYLKSAPKHIAFATSLAINKTAQLVKDAENAKLREVFDRPTRFTLTSLQLKPSDYRVKPITARVWFRNYNNRDHYLVPQVEGGTRPQKPFEKRLQAAGYLPNGWYVVPGKGARLDSSGNVSRGQINQVLSVLRAQFDAYSNTTERSKKRAARKPRDFITSTPRAPIKSKSGHLPYGVWERIGGKTKGTIARYKAIMIFVPRVHYRKRYDFYGVAQKVWDSNIVEQTRSAVQYALATAR